MPAPIFHTPEPLLPHVFAHDGHVAAVASAANISRRTLLNYRKRWPELEDAFKAAKANATDAVESALIKAAKAGEPWAVKYYLSTQAKDRGYVVGVDVEAIVREELEAVVTLLEEELEPDVFRQVAAVLARKMG
jgi:hypothetical protein